VSCSTISIDELDKTIPVSPPNVNRKINPNPHNSEGVNVKQAPCIVLSQLNTLIPVGTAITIVTVVKYPRVSTSIPTENM